MIGDPEFSKGEWETAPVYLGPGTRDLRDASGVVMLDFGALEMLANFQAESGAFSAPNGLATETAPVMIGDTPGAFIKVSSLGEDDYLVYTPKEPEILVVINGILTVKNYSSFNIFSADSSITDALTSGDIMQLEPEGVQMTAIGLELQAESLALTITETTPGQNRG